MPIEPTEPADAAPVPAESADVVFPTKLLGHRTGTRREEGGSSSYYVDVDTYTAHPIPVTRPATGHARVSLRCESCGETVQLTLWARGARRRISMRRWMVFGAVSAVLWSLAGVLLSGVLLSRARAPSSPLVIAVALLGSIWLLVLVFAATISSGTRSVDDDGDWVDYDGPSADHHLLWPGQSEVMWTYVEGSG
ncbi:hypothetical protein [Actinocrinis sp.]|uniref:hypothetical protein n=1 Tax=Actinocrinis sp. TaxID=1920516 RepID=UPI002DDD0C4C|nr:hypothetical protein [Actinocrinis sp.]